MLNKGNIVNELKKNTSAALCTFSLKLKSCKMMMKILFFSLYCELSLLGHLHKCHSDHSSSLSSCLLILGVKFWAVISICHNLAIFPPLQSSSSCSLDPIFSSISWIFSDSSTLHFHIQCLSWQVYFSHSSIPSDVFLFHPILYISSMHSLFYFSLFMLQSLFILPETCVCIY